ncbi:DegT/DnrJ/EryC1/StrS family aminotransferase [Rhodohalobacter mucosus]
MGGSELDYIHEAFETNWIAPLGANVNGFEQDLASYTGRKEAAAITSGTAGLHLALILCGVEPGDEVFCQSFTFAASANPIRYQGAVPVFIDSEPDTWNMDPDLLEKALEERAGPSSDEFASSDESPGRVAAIHPIRRTDRMKPQMPKAIIVVHLYGMPAKMDRIMEVANKYGVPVIEDSAEALGSSINGRKCGTYGKFSVLSFNGNKIITTSGGGALLSDDEELVKKARFLATQARDDAPHYQHSQLGFNYRMSNIVAGIGRGQIKVLDEHVAKRRANHEFYFENLGKTWFQGTGRKVQGKSANEQGMESEKNPPVSPLGKGGILFPSQTRVEDNLEPETLNLKPKGSPTGIYFLPEPPGYFSNRWLTTILVNPKETGGITREDIRLALEEQNIETRPLWKPMHMQPLYEGCEFYGHPPSDEFTSSDESDAIGLCGTLFEYGLCLPSGSNLTDEERERVLRAIKKVLKKG